MAIDTENKRRSTQSIPGFPFSWPEATGTIVEGDRAHTCGVYSGFDYKGTYVTPILTRIVDKITVLINAYMLQSNGFSQDYGSVNEYIHGDRTYPAVFYSYPNSDDLGDERDMENRYSEETPFTIEVISSTEADLEVVSDRVISDFKKLFAEFQKTLKVEGLVDYRYMGTEKEKREVKAYPLSTKMTYLLKYRRIMNDVYTVDSSSTAETFTGSAWSSETPIWNTIISNIKTYTGQMTTANGYQYNYGSIDEYIHDDRTYPAIFLEYPEEIALPEEENEIFKYTCAQDLTIKIISVTESDLDKLMYIYRSDFNKMFNDKRELLENVGMEESEWMGSVKAFRPVKAYPTEIELKYKIHFNTQKKNPYLT